MTNLVRAFSSSPFKRTHHALERRRIEPRGTPRRKEGVASKMEDALYRAPPGTQAAAE
jgi:hypothetical protein